MKVIRTLAAGTVIAVSAVMAGRVEAQSWPGSQGESMASFGASVLVDGDRVLVGRSNQGGAFTDQTGAVHIFSRDPASNTWKEAGTFKGADTRIGDEFGFTMTLDGDLLAVSAPKSGNGAVYLFQRRGQDWVEMARIAAQENTPSDEFGRALALRNGMLLIGAPRATRSAGRCTSRAVTRAGPGRLRSSSPGGRSPSSGWGGRSPWSGRG